MRLQWKKCYFEPYELDGVPAPILESEVRQIKLRSQLLDHIIIGQKGMYNSFRDLGLISGG